MGLLINFFKVGNRLNIRVLKVAYPNFKNNFVWR